MKKKRNRWMLTRSRLELTPQLPITGPVVILIHREYNYSYRVWIGNRCVATESTLEAAKQTALNIAP